MIFITIMHVNAIVFDNQNFSIMHDTLHVHIMASLVPILQSPNPGAGTDPKTWAEGGDVALLPSPKTQPFL